MDFFDFLKHSLGTKDKKKKNTFELLYFFVFFCFFSKFTEGITDLFLESYKKLLLKQSQMGKTAKKQCPPKRRAVPSSIGYYAINANRLITNTSKE